VVLSRGCEAFGREFKKRCRSRHYFQQIDQPTLFWVLQLVENGVDSSSSSTSVDLETLGHAAQTSHLSSSLVVEREQLKFGHKV